VRRRPKRRLGHEWVKRVEVDRRVRPGISSDMAEKMKALERENRELRQANEILRQPVLSFAEGASAYFAQAELDRPFKR
jgi:transposase